MEAIGHRQPRSFYGAPSVYDQHGKRVKTYTFREKETQVARSRDKTSPCSYNYEPSLPHNKRTEIASKPASRSSWWNDRDLDRKRRVAKYKLYAVPGKLKSSLQKGFHHLKMTCKKILV
ncbi:uncharacterized protein LOC131627508 [Vicia villosa]|uniref:uncharacterized protein LOC131627508 n=1 Tax=Vicia villosa TaxID=3911 RepID=UPI00273AD6DB|nr:uncharacterized protein LOC131627508 [Vicia villosa]